MNEIKGKIEIIEDYICLFKETSLVEGQTLYEEIFGGIEENLSEILERLRYKQDFQITEGEEALVNQFIKFIDSLNDALAKIEERKGRKNNEVIDQVGQEAG